MGIFQVECCLWKLCKVKCSACNISNSIIQSQILIWTDSITIMNWNWQHSEIEWNCSTLDTHTHKLHTAICLWKFVAQQLMHKNDANWMCSRSNENNNNNNTGIDAYTQSIYWSDNHASQSIFFYHFWLLHFFMFCICFAKAALYISKCYE